MWRVKDDRVVGVDRFLWGAVVWMAEHRVICLPVVPIKRKSGWIDTGRRTTVDGVSLLGIGSGFDIFTGRF